MKREDLLTAVLVGLAISQVVALAITRRTAGASGKEQGSYIGLDTGAMAEFRVRLANMEEPVKVSQLAAGSCLYVVIFSPTCGASIQAAREWISTERDRNDSGPRPVYRALWVSVEDSATTGHVLPEGLAVARGYRASGERLEAQLEMTAYPVHVLVDADGYVRAADVGAPLPSAAMLRSFCPSGQAADRRLLAARQ